MEAVSGTMTQEGRSWVGRSYSYNIGASSHTTQLVDNYDGRVLFYEKAL